MKSTRGRFRTIRFSTDIHASIKNDTQSTERDKNLGSQIVLGCHSSHWVHDLPVTLRLLSLPLIHLYLLILQHPEGEGGEESQKEGKKGGGRRRERLEQYIKLYTVNNGTYCVTIPSSGTLFTIRANCSLHTFEEDNSIST